MIEPKESGYFWYKDDNLQNKILCKVTINSANEPDVEFFESDYSIMRYNEYSEEELRDLHPEFTKVEPELILNEYGRDLEKCFGITERRVQEIIKISETTVTANLRNDIGSMIVKVLLNKALSIKERIFASCIVVLGLCKMIQDGGGQL